MIPIKEKIEKKTKEIGDKNRELFNLNKVLDTYPDAEIYIDRWHNEYVCSKSVNEEVDEVDFNHNCGCCSDSPLQAWPFIDFNGTKIHSSPACFIVATRNAWGYGEIPETLWEEKLRKENINEGVIKQIEKYLEEHKPEYDYDEEEDEYL